MSEPIKCPRCDGKGENFDFSSESYPDPCECVTCHGTGKVFVYEHLITSSGGVSAEIQVYGHRPPRDETAFEDLTWKVSSKATSKLVDAMLKHFGVRTAA